MSEKKKPGRPKGKPLSPKERAQRQSAALKTGEYSQRLLGQALPPCKTSACPEERPGGSGYPCDTKQQIDAGGGGLSVCLPALAQADVSERFRKAIQDGDLKGLNELAADSLGAWTLLERSQLEMLLKEGLTIERPIVKQGDEGPEILGTIVVENPRAERLLDLSKLLGHSADSQVITPKSRGEKSANEGVGRLGQLAWINGMRRGLAGEGENS